MRWLFILFTLLLVLAAGGFLLLRLNVISLPFGPQQSQSTPSLFNVVQTGELTEVITLIGAGAGLETKDQYGQTPLTYAVEARRRDVVSVLLAAGANVNVRTDSNWTPLMYAVRDAESLELPIMLLNAGADPTVVNDEGQTVLDLAGMTVRASPLYRRIEELVTSPRPFDPDWPSAYQVPIEGATLSSRASHLPNAPRAYRNGIHEGFDFYQGVVSVVITYGTPILAVADGRVIRADHGYLEMTQEEYDEIIRVSRNSLITPDNFLDKLRGRQVWLEHAGGFITRYAHLSDIPANVQVGNSVRQGDPIGATGNSGTIEAVSGTLDDPHPHVEIWRGDTFLGQGLEPGAIYDLAAQVFGQRALPPFRE